MWLIVVLGTALGAATADIFFSQQKFLGLSSFSKVLIVRLASLPVIGIVLASRGLPVIATHFWMYTALNAVLDTIASLCLMYALAASPISQTQPLLAVTPALMLVTTPLLTNDVVTPLGILGVLAVTVGIYATQYPGKGAAPDESASFWTPLRAIVKDKGARAMLLAAAIFAVTRNLDRVCIDAASGPFYLFAENVLMGVLLIAAMVVRRRFPPTTARFVAPLAPRPSPLLIMVGGSICALAFLVHIWALEFVSAAYLIAVKRTSIVLTSLWGYFVRKERPPNWYRLGGVFLAAGGIVLIVLYGKK